MNGTNSFVGPNLSEAREFTRHLTDLLRKEHGAMLTFLLALNECDGRRLWAELGYASLFDYLHRELKLSRSAAYFRTAAARLVLDYPEIADALAEGKLCLSTAGELSKVVTPENVGTVLPRFFHLSAREAREVVAELAPRPAPPRREVVTAVRFEPVPVPVAPAALSVTPPQPLQATTILRHGAGPDVRTPDLGQVPITDSSTREPSPAASSEQRSEEHVEPLTADLRRYHVTVTKHWLEKLQVKKLRTVWDETTASGTSTPEPSAPALSANGKRKAIPAHVRREVLKRDEGKCQARLHDGTICGSTVRLEFDHAIPDALGGPATVENIQLRCRDHNQLAAREVFGDAAIDLFSSRRPGRRA